MDHYEVKRSLDMESDEEECYDAQTETPYETTVLTEELIRELMESDIKNLSETYSISVAEATLLLPRFHRSVSQFHNQWFDDTTSVRESVGLLETPLDGIDNDTEFFCGVCFKTRPLENSASVSCGHRVCIFCWPGHINNIINDIPAAEWNLRLKCPYVSCQASVGRDMVERFASKEEKSNYNRFLLKSYVEGSKSMKLCPRAALGRSCETDPSPDSGSSDVYCVCLLSFCWNCSKDVHSPVDCKTAAKWLAMNSSDYQNPNWILAHTVPCPKCKRRVEENNFFSLKMECLPPCNFEFCWLCRGAWTEHGDNRCHDIDAVSYEEDNQQWKMAESAAVRYKYCYQNWDRSESMMKYSKAYLKHLDTFIQKLSNTQLATEPEIKLILDAAWLQIIECRRVLKWTYAYEYYLREDEVEKRAFLKHKQVNAEIPLKKLCMYVEKKLYTFLYVEKPSQEFTKVTRELTELTSITRHHYECLVREIEDGLRNVTPASASQIANNDDANGSSHIHDD